MNSNVKLHLRTPHLLMVLFPQISWSGLKSPPGWALLISKASQRCSRNPQKQAGSREGNTREPCESLHHHRVVSTTSQNQVRTGSAQTKPVLAWQGETWPSHTGLWWQEGDKGTPNTEWLQQIYCCSLAADTSTGLCELQKSSPCLSVHPSLWTTNTCLQAWFCQSVYSRISILHKTSWFSLPAHSETQHYPNTFISTRGSDQPLLSLNFNPFTNAWRAELLKLNLCFIWTQQWYRLQGRDLNSTLFMSNPCVFTRCLQGYTAHVNNLPSYYTGIIAFFKICS